MNIDSTTLKNTLLAGLSEEEQVLAFSMLNEISKDGSSEQYNNLLYADFKEIPVDIDTFIDDDKYMGKAWKDSEGKSKLFPEWRNVLHRLFPDNITTDVNTLLESGARGIGKSENACGCVAAYLMYRVMCLKNPTEYYGLKVTEKIVFAFMNITKALAEKIAIDKFQKSIQLSPWFMSQGRMTSYKNSPFWLPPEPLEIVIGSQSSDVIGQPIYFAFFDEISFVKHMDVDKQKAKAIDMIDTALGGMKTRFIRAGGKDPTVLVVASSKRSEQSFMETYIKDKFESEPDNIIVVDKPVWEVQPRENFTKEEFKVAVGDKFHVSQIIPNNANIDSFLKKGYTRILDVPCTFLAKFKEDIDRSLCDYAGISSSDLSKYISGEIVQENINLNRFNPFQMDVLEIGNAKDDTRQYYNFFDIEKIPQELKNKPMCIHLDMSKTGDMTGIAGTCISGKKFNQDGTPGKDLFFSLMFSVSIKAPKGRQISFEKNRNFIRWLRDQGFNILKVTADQFQSSDLLQILEAEGFNTDLLSVDRVNSEQVCLPYQSFKNALYEHRFDLYNSKRLIDEITDLERNGTNGKIDHPPNGHKDVSDAACGSMYDCIEFADKYAYDYGENYAIIKDVNMNGYDKTVEELNREFEEALLNADSRNGSAIMTDDDYKSIGLIPPTKDDENSWLMVI